MEGYLFFELQRGKKSDNLNICQYDLWWSIFMCVQDGARRLLHIFYRNV